MSVRPPLVAPIEHPELADLARRLDELLAQGGPRPREYAEIDEALASVWAWARRDPTAWTEAAKLQALFPEGFLRETVHGHGLAKPMGYAGDFLMIDRIYVRDVSPLEPFRRWDEYFHTHAAPRAVRGRKDYFQRLLDQVRGRASGPIRILNLGTGPGRDLAEYLRGAPEADLDIVSVDLDPRASRYARQVIGLDEQRVRLVTGNALRFTSPERFDLIWSAGLFDYLNDRLFTRLLRRLRPMLLPGGEVVVGNFAASNPSRAYMELLGDWHLFHRSASELSALARRAGFAPERSRVGAEPLGVNLFLHVGAPAA